MKLNLEANNMIEVFNITAERSDELQDIVESVTTTGNENGEFTIQEVILKVNESVDSQEELGFCLVAIGRQIGLIEAQESMSVFLHPKF